MVDEDEEERIPLTPPRSKGLGPHPGIPWAMFGRRECDSLWTLFRLTTYGASKVGLTPSQAVAVLEDRPHMAMTERAGRARLDILIRKWREERCKPQR